ncbi:hypothetical protein [Priestia megaterium]|uniref:hypothetical protein n=1 Tax=Priestia megaterium TaxID=1404 RepID=UPI002E1B1CE1|nr:hypothetical protein [Priestia megaterium]
MYPQFNFLLYVPYLTINLLFILLKRKLNVNPFMQVVFILLFVTYIITPILGLTIFKYDPLNNLFYISLYVIFIFSILVVVSFINKQNYQSVILALLLGNSVLLIINIIVNISDINLVNLKWVFGEDRESRAYFGFSHPNTAGMYIFIEILLLSLWRKYNNKIIFLFNVFLFFILVLTGSRTAILALVLFILLELYAKLKIKWNLYLSAAFTWGIVLPLLILLLKDIDFGSFFKNISGRDVAAVQNIQVLLSTNNAIFGIAPVNVSNLKSINGLTYSDNWYITHTIQFGIVSLLLFMFNLFILFLESIRHRNKLSINLLLLIIFYSFAENVMFVPGVLMSCIVWILILSQINLNTYNGGVK